MAKMLGFACLGTLASASVQAEEVDLLSEAEAPSSAEIAATISPLSVEVGRIEIVDPRSLRQEVEEEGRSFHDPVAENTMRVPSMKLGKL